MKDQIQLHEIAGYLPYGLKRHCPSSNVLIHDYMPLDFTQSTIDLHTKFGWKPILRPMSDLTDEMAIKIGYKDSNALRLMIKSKQLPYQGFENLFKHHYDVFNLIGRKLAVDINTLKD